MPWAVDIIASVDIGFKVDGGLFVFIHHTFKPTYKIMKNLYLNE